MAQRTMHVAALSALLVAGSIGLALAQGGGGGGGGGAGGGAGGAAGAGGMSSGTSPGGATGPGGTTGAGPSSGPQTSPTSPSGTGLNNNNTLNNRPCGPGSLGSNTGTTTGSSGTTTGSAGLDQQPNIATDNDPTRGTNQTSPSLNPRNGTGRTLGSGC
jgi:hypothetical protein